MSEEKSIIALGNKGIQLTNFEELFRFSQFVSKAGFAPRGMETPEKVFLAVQMGLELGLSPMMSLQNAAVINGRPGFYGELVLGIIQSHPSFDDMTTEYTGTGDDYACEVTIKRKGRSPSVGRFTVRQAKEADLLGNPSKKETWGKYTDDMLMWRAFSRARRIFSDVLRGFKTVEELKDYPEEKIAKAIEIKKPEIASSQEHVVIHHAPDGRPISEIKKVPVGERIDSRAEIKRRLSETPFTQADLMQVLHDNVLAVGVETIEEISDADTKTTLDNWESVVAQMAVPTPR